MTICVQCVPDSNEYKCCCSSTKGKKLYYLNANPKTEQAKKQAQEKKLGLAWKKIESFFRFFCFQMNYTRFIDWIFCKNMYYDHHHHYTWQMNITALIIFEVHRSYNTLARYCLNDHHECIVSTEKKYEKYPDVPTQIIFQLRSFFLLLFEVLCLNFHGPSRVHVCVCVSSCVPKCIVLLLLLMMKHEYRVSIVKHIHQHTLKHLELQWIRSVAHTHTLKPESTQNRPTGV